MMNLIDSETGRLLQSLEKVVGEWAFLNVDLLGEPAELPTLLPLERQVLFTGAEGQGGGALLVLRGSYGLGLELARCVRGIPAANLPAAEAAFTELSSLLADEWRHRFRNERGKDLVPGPAETSSPKAWPEGRPDASFAAVVRGFAVEARLWIK